MTLLDGTFPRFFWQERTRMTLLCLRLAVLSELLLGSGPSLAANVHFHKGEGGVGLDAQLELADQFYLAMGCQNVGTVQRVQLGLYIRGNKLPPELQRIANKIENKDDEGLPLYLCTNEICEE